MGYVFIYRTEQGEDLGHAAEGESRDDGHV